MNAQNVLNFLGKVTVETNFWGQNWGMEGEDGEVQNGGERGALPYKSTQPCNQQHTYIHSSLKH